MYKLKTFFNSFFVTKPLNATCQDNSTVIVKYTGFNKTTWNNNLQGKSFINYKWETAVFYTSFGNK